ncbi:hypothetical protein L207DRAFT_577839 [Hyaloscypha variabilis F]|uniref:Uncharacterized protein n=1 Tax=Hyaloscypha variabilis (strain UAMH 11265 / GT02V1 / F) TaxID=1149755 RepID=A0A2J6S2B6_HYAVF|nr:hypothetical protein L207DRAFT_577839 [Hyaloscypha variabilis F]
MPVLSESTTSSIPGLELPYVFIGGSLLVILGVLISRKTKSNKTSTMPLPSIPEKASLPNQETTPSPSPPPTIPQPHSAPFPRPPQPLPFTPPTLSPAIFAAPPGPGPLFIDLPSQGLNASYYQSYDDESYPPFTTSPTTYSPPPFPEPSALSQPPTGSPVSPLPRRRSYTKTLSTSSVSSSGSSGSGSSSTSGSIVVTGEILQAEGWRRHTRVFGGGVCKACEESERRMGG